MQLVAIMVVLYLSVVRSVSHNSSSASANCSDTEFPCLSGECIDVKLACNGAPNCNDGSDKVEPACYFGKIFAFFGDIRYISMCFIFISKVSPINSTLHLLTLTVLVPTIDALGHFETG